MSTRIMGVESVSTFTPPAPFTDEWIDAIYASLEKNMAIVSADLMIDENVGQITFLLGIQGFVTSDEQFFTDVAQEAIQKAFVDAAGPNTRVAERDVRSNLIPEFA